MLRTTIKCLGVRAFTGYRIMRFLLLFIVFAFHPVLFAETSLCVADAGAIVEDGGGQSAKAWVVDVAVGLPLSIT
jgi:hypothetical protein